MIAVTGAAGFIGSCFVKTLNEKGYDDILIIDSLEQDDRPVICPLRTPCANAMTDVNAMMHNMEHTRTKYFIHVLRM